MSFSVSTNPGGYGGVKSPNPPTIWFVPRDPTVNDWQNYVLGDEWVNIQQGVVRWFKLLSLENNQGTWIKQDSTDTVNGLVPQTGTSPVLPNVATGYITINGAVVAAGTNPVRTDGTGANTMALEVQISQAIAATDATKIGLASFNSAMFSVDANGFVSLGGGGLAIDSIGTQTGTNPIVPTAGGLVTINGAVVAAGTNPIRTDGTGANTMAVEVQISQAIAATDATKIGLSAFDSTRFSVDANGFVSTSGTGVLTSLNGDTGTATPTAGAITISGGITGLTNTGSASTITLGGTLNIGHGGTGLGTTPTNGQILIGNGTNYTLATLTQGTGVTITNGAGSITIAATASSSALVLLSTQTASNSANITFNNTFITGTYSKYLVLMNNVVPAAGGGPYLQMQVSSNNGSSFIATGYVTGSTGADTGSGVSGQALATGFMMSQSGGTIGLPTTSSYRGFCYIYDFTNGCSMEGCCTYRQVGGAQNIFPNNFGGAGPAATSVNAIQFTMNSGNISTGTFSLYGILS